MAYIRRRGKGWYVEIRKPGVEKNATFDSKTEAAQWAADTESLIVAGKSNDVPDITFGQLLDRYARNVRCTRDLRTATQDSRYDLHGRETPSE